MTKKPRIAHLAGSNATILNSPPLVTSNKARAKYGLAPLQLPDGSPARYDVLRPQRLARPATVYLEQFSAHPLERDAFELYGPPDGYVDGRGQFNKERVNAGDTPVYEVELRPEDGLYPMPYMARQANQHAWDDDVAEPGTDASRARQPFFPDGARLVEEIERLGIGEHGTGNLIAARAELDFYRVIPSGGYTKGLSAAERTDTGPGDIPAESRGRDFFPYRPVHLGAHPARPSLARITNALQKILASGDYAGAIWNQGSPRIEETMYWLNLLLDTTLPVCGNAAQRTHGQIGSDGPKNIVDSVEYISSRVWADEHGRNRAGMVLIQEQQVFAVRDVQKGDARPGGYVTTGGHGGILGAVGHEGPPVLNYLPATRHTYRSEVNITRLPASVNGVRLEAAGDLRIVTVAVPIKDESGELLEGAIPRVAIIKDGNYRADDYEPDVDSEVDVLALTQRYLQVAPLAGFVYEGHSPYGTVTSGSRQQALLRAVHSGLPVVRVGRGNNDGFTQPVDRFLGGKNLTATKARLLLMACLMSFGSLPSATDPARPTPEEQAAVRAKLAQYQAVFDTH